MSATYRTDGLHPEMTAAADPGAALEQLADSVYHQAYRDVAPDPGRWPTWSGRCSTWTRSRRTGPRRRSPRSRRRPCWVVADSDIVRLEHAVEMFHLLGGGVAGDLHGLPAARLAGRVRTGSTPPGLAAGLELVAGELRWSSVGDLADLARAL